MGNRTQPEGQSGWRSWGGAVSGRHFVNNEDVFAIFKFLQMFLHRPEPEPQVGRVGNRKTHRAVFRFCLSVKRRLDAQLEGNWGAIPENYGQESESGRSGGSSVYFIRILAGNYIFKISCEPWARGAFA